ncbi:hypothetical protein COCON_G00085530 [Conger conger]|uniref:receptor protein-tyrosine kinase n=1 Tax=Conger conger TaxID=82655 RepID=A0A9Q1I2C4_CONCO|nr:hypothetical protein COCON_G00085530 [Conger conger]
MVLSSQLSVLILCLTHSALSKSVLSEESRVKEHRPPHPLLQPGHPENATVRAGGQVELRCRVHRPGTTRVQWLKRDPDHTGPGGLPLLRALTVSDSSVSKVSVLPLTSVTVGDSGEYVCRAQNSALQAEQSAWLHVLPVPEKPPPWSPGLEAPSEHPADGPEELGEDVVEHLILEPGDVLKLRCDSSRPGALLWFRGEQRVTHSARIQIRSGVMEVSDVTYEDSGLYVCVLRGTREPLRNFSITVADSLGSGDDDEDNGLDDTSTEMEKDQVYFTRVELM